jgi:hypothetical protein
MSKETDLATLAALVHFFLHDDIPDGGTPGSPEDGAWNLNPKVTRDALNLVGDFFTDTDGVLAALAAKYTANHNPDGSHVPPVEWIPDPATPTYISPTSFTLVGDRSADYRAGERVRAHQGAGGSTLVVCTILTVSPAPATNTTTVVVRTATVVAPVASTLVAIDRALVRETAPRVGGFDLLDAAVNDPRILLDGVVLGPKLGTGSVDNTKLLDGSVLASKIAPGAVLAAALGPGSVLSAAIGTGQVLQTHLGTGSVTNLKIGNNAVHANHIADAQVQERHIVDGQVTADKIAPGNVFGFHLADNLIGTPKLIDGAVTPAKLALESYGSPSGNTTVVPRRQSGWHFIPLNATDRTWSRAITFPQVFTTLRGLRVQCLGIKTTAGDPTHPFDTDSKKTHPDTGSSGNEYLMLMEPKGGATTLAGFIAIAAANLGTANFTTQDKAVFYWEAFGA